MLKNTTGTLYSVAMPIGNYDDISHRALHLLQTVDVIACEDTRKLRSWLSFFKITTTARFLAYHARNEKESAKGLLQLLERGQNIAFVSDAGTPRISDPGFHLLKECWNNNISISPIPGASALTAIVSVAPFLVEPLLFLGFLSSKQGKRKKSILLYKEFIGCICIFESTHRIQDLLQDILDSWGDVYGLMGRELTKIHEDIVYTNISSMLGLVENPKGEYVLLINKTV